MRAGVVGPAACRPLQAFAGAERARLFAAGIRDELLVEAPTGRLVRGVAGMGVLLAHAGRRRTAALLRLAPVRVVAAFVYRLVAANRRVLAPIDEARRAACDCDPVSRVGTRCAFVVLCLAVACGVAAGVGVLLATFAGVAAGRGAFLGLGAPILLALPALLVLPGVPRSRRGEAVAHVALQAVQAILAAARSTAMLVIAFAIVLGALFLLAYGAQWAPPLRLFANLYPLVWVTILVVASATSIHVFVRGLARRLRAIREAA